jgi:hypothetical protein
MASLSDPSLERQAVPGFIGLTSLSATPDGPAHLSRDVS